MCLLDGTKYVLFALFLGIVRGPRKGRGGGPGTVPLQNPQVTSRKACLRNADNVGSEKKHIKIKTCKQIFTGLSRDFWGDFVYVFFFSPIRNDPKKHINNFLAPIQSRDNPANLYMFMCFFFS